MCGGGRAFHLPNVLGARYLDYHLHRPNQPISAFDLEVAVSPEKGEAGATNSIQPESAARVLAEYREELGRLQERRKELEAVGAVRKHLRQGGPEERAFEEHLRSHLSLGHECMYTAPEGRVWV